MARRRKRKPRTPPPGKPLGPPAPGPNAPTKPAHSPELPNKEVKVVVEHNAPPPTTQSANLFDTVVEGASKHPFFTAICSLAFVGFILLYFFGKLEPLVAAGGSIFVFGMVVFMGIAERLLTIIHATPAEVKIATPLSFLIWSFSSGVGGGFVGIIIIGFIYTVIHLLIYPDQAIPPPMYGSRDIEMMSKPTIEELNIFPNVVTRNPKDPSYNYLISMSDFPLWLKNGANPPSNFNFQRVIFSASQSSFNPPYKSMSATVRCIGYEVVQGTAFLVKKGPELVDGVPSFNYRQLPFKLYAKSKDKDEPTDYDNDLMIPETQENERLFLVLRIQHPRKGDISKEEAFSVTVTVGNKQ